jgi:hypothetical protein
LRPSWESFTSVGERSWRCPSPLGRAHIPHPGPIVDAGGPSWFYLYIAIRDAIGQGIADRLGNLTRGRPARNRRRCAGGPAVAPVRPRPEGAEEMLGLPSIRSLARNADGLRLPPFTTRRGCAGGRPTPRACSHPAAGPRRLR